MPMVIFYPRSLKNTNEMKRLLGRSTNTIYISAEAIEAYDEGDMHFGLNVTIETNTRPFDDVAFYPRVMTAHTLQFPCWDSLALSSSTPVDMNFL